MRRWQAYIFIAGPVAWLGLLKAHVHPALALCFVVPFMPASCARAQTSKSERHLPMRAFERTLTGTNFRSTMLNSVGSGLRRARRTVSSVQDYLDSTKLDESTEFAASQIADQIGDVSEEKKKIATARAVALLARIRSAPLHEFEHSMKLPVDIGMFFFGLANAGVQVNSVGGVTWSVIIALIVGKMLGIAGFAMMAQCMGYPLPDGVTVVDVISAGCLGGIGLTVALFVANEAFVDPGLQGQAKMGAVLSVGAAFFAWAIRKVGERTRWGSQSLEIAEEDEDLSTWNSRSSSRASCGGPQIGRSSIFTVAAFADGLEAGVNDSPRETTSQEDEEWIEDALVDDICQTLWTMSKYQKRGTVYDAAASRKSCRQTVRLPQGESLESLGFGPMMGHSSSMPAATGKRSSWFGPSISQPVEVQPAVPFKRRLSATSIAIAQGAQEANRSGSKGSSRGSRFSFFQPFEAPSGLTLEVRAAEEEDA
jgi:hypothetical protein